jgi:uncharacterized protein (DUF934 family)
MTEDQILELAKTCGFDSFTPEEKVCWECWEDQLLKFAKVMYEEGYDQGCYEATGGQ